MRRKTATEGVGQQLVGDALGEILLVDFKHRGQFQRAGERAAVRQRTRRIDGEFADLLAPFSDRVEIFETETERIHPHVT